MPLPWKKARISRISRLMADLHPSKPCNSLLLQTGFPTSLVDLFVRNSDRLKKPNKKRKQKRQPNRNLSEISVPDPVHSPTSDELIPAVNLCEEVERKDDLDNLDVSRSDDGGFGIDCKSDEILNAGCCNGGGSGAFYAAFIVSVAVVLALISIRMLTLGITMSACALICVDYIRKHFLCSCSGFPFEFPFGLFVVRFKTQIGEEAKPEEKEDDKIVPISPVEEIQVVESEVRFGEGNGIKLISEEEGDDDECDSETIEKATIPRRSRSKGFIKKLVPKKWRKAKTSKKRDEFVGSDLSDDDKSGGNEQNQEPMDLGGSVKEAKIQPKEETNEISDKEEAFERKEKRGWCCVVVVAALAGLVGGRVVAMGLTVVCCVIIQFFVIRQRQQLNNMKRKSL